jgi:mRNA interferase MazF
VDLEDAETTAAIDALLDGDQDVAFVERAAGDLSRHDRYNRSRQRTVTVVVLSSSVRLAALPGKLLVGADVSGSARTRWSTSRGSRPSTVPRSRSAPGKLPSWLMTQVDDGLRRALAL